MSGFLFKHGMERLAHRLEFALHVGQQGRGAVDAAAAAELFEIAAGRGQAARAARIISAWADPYLT